MNIQRLSEFQAKDLYWSIFLNKSYLKKFEWFYPQYKDILNIDFLISFKSQYQDTPLIDIIKTTKYHLMSLFDFLNQEKQNLNLNLDLESKKNYILILFLHFLFGTVYLTKDNKSDKLSLSIIDKFGFLIIIKDDNVINIIDQQQCILKRSNEPPFFLVSLVDFNLED